MLKVAKVVVLAAVAALVVACGGKEAAKSETSATPAKPAEKKVLDLGPIAEQYVKLCLAMNVHDDGFVDSYYGPPEWKTEAEAAKKGLDAIRAEVRGLIATLDAGRGKDEDDERRRAYLASQLGAFDARIDMVQGKKMTFDEEAMRLYGVQPPHHDEEHFKDGLAQLERVLPGKGDVYDRLQKLRSKLVIPPRRIARVFEAALQECRDQTLKFMQLPEGESFKIEYVKDKPWSGYNWYQGNYKSVIQVNTDLPIYIDRAIDIACHEGYPGHHVLISTIEHDLVKGKGWVEFSVFPLYSPESLIAEGTAEYGVSMIFPGDSRVYFEQDTLYPLARLDPKLAETYFKVTRVLETLSYATNEAAQRYLDGEIDAKSAQMWLEGYELMTPQLAARRMKFIDHYRSYVVTYNVGQDLVKQWVEAAGPEEARQKRFIELQSTPYLPSDLEE